MHIIGGDSGQEWEEAGQRLKGQVKVEVER
jgi:hypothetical protein